MNSYVFSPLLQEDIEKVYSLFDFLKRENAEVSFSDVHHIDELISWVNNPAHLTFVAKDTKSGDVLSVIRGKRDMSFQKQHAVFLTAATHPHARGNGLAAQLTNYALKEMKSLGVKIARIYVYSDNFASLNAVKKLGFEHAGTVKWHHFNPQLKEFVDDLIFHKIL